MSRHFRSQIVTSAYGIARFGLRARPAHKAHFFNRPTWAGMPGETCNRGLQTMKTKALGAEFFGTFMLMASVLGAAFYAFGAPAGPAGILGVALSIGCTVMALAYAIGHVSGGHYNPAVTLGLVAGGRFPMNDAVPYIVAQVLGASSACGVF